MKDIAVVGIDPGPVPGLVYLRYIGGAFAEPIIVQTSHNYAGRVLYDVISQDGCDELHVQLEAFVVGNRAARSSTPKAGAITRQLLGDLTFIASEALPAPRIHIKRATDVKPWATDARLDAVGLLEATAGMRHARDAARHAIYCAVQSGGIPDPLSKRSHS